MRKYSEESYANTFGNLSKMDKFTLKINLPKQ